MHRLEPEKIKIWKRGMHRLFKGGEFRNPVYRFSRLLNASNSRGSKIGVNRGLKRASYCQKALFQRTEAPFFYILYFNPPISRLLEKKGYGDKL